MATEKTIMKKCSSRRNRRPGNAGRSARRTGDMPGPTIRGVPQRMAQHENHRWIELFHPISGPAATWLRGEAEPISISTSSCPQL